MKRKGRLFLFHWKTAEAAELAKGLRKLGWTVDFEGENGARGGKKVIETLPDAVVFYLTRLPSHSRATAEYLAQRKATRPIPLIFVDGKDEAVAKTREKIPTGVFTTSADLPRRLAKLAEKG